MTTGAMTTAVAMGVAALAALAGAVTAGPAHADQTDRVSPTVAFRLTDRRIIESSGLATSTRHAGVTWTHNDSGGGPRLYAVGRDGRTRARLTLAGLDPYDWEGIASGPDHTLWVGDIGDNSQRRETIALFRVTEPARLANGTVDWTRFRFRYPDGPHDAEAVLVHPQTGRVYVATKSVIGGGLYVGPQRLLLASTGRVNELTRVAGVPPLVTDGAFAPDGSRFVLRGYLSAWLFDEPGRQIERIALPDMEQGESVTFSADGTSLLAGTEGAKSPVWRVPLPAAAVAVSAPRPTRSGKTRPAAPAATKSTGSAVRSSEPAPSIVPMLAAGAGVVAALTTIGVTLRRRRSTRGG
jgi:hypothetical protein